MLKNFLVLNPKFSYQRKYLENYYKAEIYSEQLYIRLKILNFYYIEDLQNLENKDFACPNHM